MIAALSAGGDRVAGAQNTAITCFASLESALTQELVATSDHSPCAKNACPVLKPRGARTVLKKQECSQEPRGEPMKNLLLVAVITAFATPAVAGGVAEKKKHDAVEESLAKSAAAIKGLRQAVQGRVRLEGIRSARSATCRTWHGCRFRP